MTAEELLKTGQVDEALAQLKSEIRSNPAEPKLRNFLVHLQILTGDWEGAKAQIKVAEDLEKNPDNQLRAKVTAQLLFCERMRQQVFKGTQTPFVFGEPAEWIASLIEANKQVCEGNATAADALRDKAFESAPAVPGALNGEAFEWIADADMRFGPIFEAFIEGRYYWVPVDRIHYMKVDEPEDLRDAVWMPATFVWTNGGQSAGFIPTRYPGSENHQDSLVRMAKRTEWAELAPDFFAGLGQRVVATDAGEYALMDVRELTLENTESEGAAE